MAISDEHWAEVLEYLSLKGQEQQVPLAGIDPTILALRGCLEDLTPRERLQELLAETKKAALKARLFTEYDQLLATAAELEGDDG